MRPAQAVFLNSFLRGRCCLKRSKVGLQVDRNVGLEVDKVACWLQKDENDSLQVVRNSEMTRCR